MKSAIGHSVRLVFAVVADPVVAEPFIVGRRQHVSSASAAVERRILGAAHAAISAPGKRSSTACTSGSARTPVSSSACCASACDLQRRLRRLRRHHHHPAPAGPLLELARQLVDQRLGGARLQRDFEPAVLAAHQPHVALERGSSSAGRASPPPSATIPRSVPIGRAASRGLRHRIARRLHRWRERRARPAARRHRRAARADAPAQTARTRTIAARLTRPRRLRSRCRRAASPFSSSVRITSSGVGRSAA